MYVWCMYVWCMYVCLCVWCMCVVCVCDVWCMCVCVCAVTHCHVGHKKSGLDKKARKKLIVASVLCLVFMVGEVVGK